MKKIGPSWKGLFGKLRPLAKGGSVLADESYLRESILDAAARRTAGYDKEDYAMPNYIGVLNPSQVEAIIQQSFST